MIVQGFEACSVDASVARMDERSRTRAVYVKYMVGKEDRCQVMEIREVKRFCELAAAGWQERVRRNDADDC